MIADRCDVTATRPSSRRHVRRHGDVAVATGVGVATDVAAVGSSRLGPRHAVNVVIFVLYIFSLNSRLLNIRENM